MFVDELDIYVEAGAGGRGAVSFRREKYVEFGGPDGGDGGDGGDVYFRVRTDFNTLMPLRNRRHYRAGHGVNGRGSNMTGARGESLYLEVPPGTVVRDRDTGTILADLTKPGVDVVVARGGRGGKGNKHFSSSTMRTPKFAQPGEEGEAFWLRLELKILADVGLVGFPNAGKSTLIHKISAAKPKVADYPFTTLQPNLGVVRVGADGGFVVADIPGIIEGAHEGAGLGLRFLRHIERTTLLLIMIDASDLERSVRQAYRILRTELAAFSKRLAEKPHFVAFTKMDLPPADEAELEAMESELEAVGVPCFRVCALKGEGLKPLIYALFDKVKELKRNVVHEEDLEPEPEIQEEVSDDPLDEV